jgi:hypothetical protein
VLKSENIAALKAEIKKKRVVVYELDLKNHLVQEQAVTNEIKQTDKYWEFICERGAAMSLAEFEVICGVLSEQAGAVQAKMESHALLPQNDKIFSAIAPLNQEHDILKIEFKGHQSQTFRVFVLNDYVYQMKKELKDNACTGVKPAKPDLLQSGNIYFQLAAANTVTVFSEDKLLNWRSFHYTCEEPVSFYLDYKSNQINLNQETWRKVDTELKRLSYFELQALKGDAAASVFDLYQVSYAQNKGYVYLKPIVLASGNYELIAYHTGELEVEYCQKGMWLPADGKISLSAKNEVMLRLKMTAGTKLYDFFIALIN